MTTGCGKTMEMRSYGARGPKVSALAFGAMGIRDDSALAGGVSGSLLRALDQGVSLIDTARLYPESEAIIGRTLRAWRGPRPRLSTKLALLSFEGAVVETVEISGLNFLSAIEAHVKWKMRLQDYIEGRSAEQLQEDVICRDDQCVLGRWIHGEGGSVCGRHPLFTDLRNTHAAFHRSAAFVVILAKDQRHVEARHSIHNGEFAHTSMQVKRLLARLYVELRGVPNSSLPGRGPEVRYRRFATRVGDTLLRQGEVLVLHK